jgi:hypothetical protein
MSGQRIEKELRRFLGTKDPEVICVSGAWGVGKTFLWSHILRKTRDENAIALEAYSYVSLFGVNSITDLKQAIFQNRITVRDIGNVANAASIQRLFRSQTKLLTDLAAKIPVVGDFVPSAATLLLQTIADQIICIDDLERTGEGLSIRDILGLVSFLKEQRRCKVVLLSNISELKDDARTQYDQHLEKVVDEVLTFEPTPAYCVKIALPEDDTDLARKCIKLGISNIRVIKRIERLVRKALAALGEVSPPVREQAVHTLALIGWITFSRETAPRMDMLSNRVSRHMQETIGGTPKDTNPREAAWRALIDSYGWHGLDDFDQVLAEGVAKGGFDEDALRRTAAELTRSVEVQAARNAQREAWAAFHDSFADNEAWVVEKITTTLHDNMKYVSPLNLNDAMRFMRELGHEAKGGALLERYVEIHKGTRDAFDLDRSSGFVGDFTEPDLIARFKAEHDSVQDERKPVDLILKLNEVGGSEDEYRRAAAITVDELIAEFEARSDTELRKLIKACLDHDRVINARPDARAISSKAKEALDKLGQKSTLNALRVRKFGVGPLARDNTENSK